MRKVLAASLAAVLFAGTFPVPARAADPPSVTPIKHIVVIFPENISFDHYYGTYPNAQNKEGETPFTYIPSTAAGHNVANTLATPLDPLHNFEPLSVPSLLTKNPNGPSGTGAKFNGAGAKNPFRLAPSQAATADQSHAPKPEQTAYHNGLVDQFPGSTGAAGPPPSVISPEGAESTTGLVMGYYDGNTVTALWNYANHFVLNDNTFTSQFGPSTPGAINLISGQTNGLAAYTNVLSSSGALLHSSHEVYDGFGGITLIGDAEPLGDVCSNTSSDNVRFSGKNIGDLLNAKGISWGWFQGGFDLSVTNGNGSTGCARYTNPTVPDFAYNSTDYVEHHEPFQYYLSTANLTHARPSATSAIGNTYEADGVTKDPANHQYDTNDFFTALDNGILPTVSFIKAPAFQDAHPGNSDPTDEQTFLVNTVNAIMNSPFWDSTAIIITYDDSDGWYDHQMPPIINTSHSSYVDALNGPGVCNTGVQQGVTSGQPKNPMFANVKGQPVLGRCGLGTRIPLTLISPWAKQNYVDHTLLNQASIIASIEDNFLGGERVQANGGSFDAHAENLYNLFDFSLTPTQRAARKLILDPATGAIK